MFQETQNNFSIKVLPFAKLDNLIGSYQLLMWITRWKWCFLGKVFRQKMKLNSTEFVVLNLRHLHKFGLKMEQGANCDFFVAFDTILQDIILKKLLEVQEWLFKHNLLWNQQKLDSLVLSYSVKKWGSYKTNTLNGAKFLVVCALFWKNLNWNKIVSKVLLTFWKWHWNNCKNSNIFLNIHAPNHNK